LSFIDAKSVSPSGRFGSVFDLTVGVFALGLIIGACFFGFRNFFKIDEQRATIDITMTPQASICLTLSMLSEADQSLKSYTSIEIF
jgi:hypothetical protein